MQISALTKLMRPIKRLLNPRVKSSLEATSEQREESKMQNAECRMQNEEYTSSTGIAGPSSPTRFAEEGYMQNEPTEESIGNQPSEEIASPLRRGGSEADGEVTEEATSPTPDTKAHLSSSVPRAAKLPQGILTKGEMAEIRSIFGDIDDAEIQRLYKRVTK